MDLKFYLNKFLKVDNIENYTLKTLIKLRERYEEFLDKSEGSDPDFPLVDFGKKGKKVKGRNAFALMDEDDIENQKTSALESRLGILGDRKQRKRDFIY